MKTGSPEAPADKLLDELLREQARGPDELFLQRIEAAVDARSQPLAVRRPAAGSPKWLAIAAGAALAAGAGIWWQSSAPPAAAPALSRSTPPAEGPLLVKSVAASPNKNRPAPPNPPNPRETAAAGMSDERLTYHHHLPEPDPFREMASMPSLAGGNSRGGALTGSSNGKLLARLPGQAADERAAFAELAADPLGDGTYGHPTPAMIPPKTAPRR